MKKRILASTMASVMALSAVGTTLVSSAAVADFKTQSVTKAELRKFLEDKEIVDLAENGGIDNYGSVSGANFMKAYEYGVAVRDDSESTNEDATAAYLMIKAAKAALIQYDRVALTALVEECRPIYNTENELNENGDLIYKASDWEKFVEAFESAEGYMEYDDIRVTTDEYENLTKYKNPGKMATKTKREIDTARQNFEKALGNEFAYQPWQRGKVTASGDYKDKEFAWGALYSHINSGADALRAEYDNFNKIKGLTITSNEDIVDAIDAMITATEVLNSFTATLESGNGSKTNTLLTQYQGQLVYTYNADVAKDVYDSFTSVATDPEFRKKGEWADNLDTSVPANTKDKYWEITKSSAEDMKPLGGGKTNTGAYVGTGSSNKVEKILAAELVVRSSEDVYYYVDSTVSLPNKKNPIVSKDDDGVYFYASKPADVEGLKVMTLKKKITLTISDLIAVTGSDIAAVAASTEAADVVAKTDALASAQDDLTSAIAGIYTPASGATPASGSLATDLSVVNTLISDLGSYSTTGLTAGDQKTALDNALAEAKTAANAVKTAINTAITKANAGTITKADLAAIDTAKTAYGTKGTALGTAVSAYNTACGSSGSVSQGTDAAAATSLASVTITTAATALDTELDALASAKEDLEDSENAFATAAAAVNKAGWNNVYDSASEGATFGSGKGLGNKYASFVLNDPYVTSKESGGCSETTASLSKAMMMLDKFNNNDWEGIRAYDNTKFITGEIKAGSKPTNKAWQLLYNYLKYALEDEFKASTSKTFTKKQVKDLLDSSYKLATDTVETKMFNLSHMALYDQRQTAAEWVKLADADKADYEDNKSEYGGADSTKTYKDLETAYNQLKKELDGFKYSYGEITATMADIAKRLDANEFKGSSASTIANDLNKVADAFVKLETLVDSSDNEFEESAVFDNDGTLNKHNRLLTSDGLDSVAAEGYDGNKFKVDKAKKDSDSNHSHWVMKEAYEKLLDDVKKATEAPAADPNDVDGSGKFDINDVSALLKLFTDDKMEVAKHDFNKDGKADVNDVKALLDLLVNT